jgi:hypothetical protein
MLLTKTEPNRRILMSKDQEDSMIQCLEDIEEINERLTCSLKKCEDLVDLPSTLIGHEAIWRDVSYGIKRIITATEDIVQKNRELMN